MFLEISRNDKSFGAFDSAVSEALPSLVDRNAGWAKRVVDTYHRLSLAKPLHDLLVEPDQAQTVADFVTKALEDLNEAGVILALREKLTTAGI